MRRKKKCFTSLDLNLYSGMQRNDYSTNLAGFGGAGSAGHVQGNVWEVLNSVRTLFYFILFYRRWFYSESLLCLFSPVQREAQLDCSERPAAIQKPLPSTCSWASSSPLLPSGTLPRFGSILLPLHLQAQHLQRVHLWGGRDDVHVGASETSCYFPKHISRI